MSIQFLPPNPDQEKVLKELESLLEILDKPVSKELKQNSRFVKRFTKSLFLVGKNLRPVPERKVRHTMEDNFETQDVGVKHFSNMQSPGIVGSEIEKGKAFHGMRSSLPRVPMAPPPAPKPLAPLIPKKKLEQKLTVEDGILKFNAIEPEMESMDWKIYNDVRLNIKQKILNKPDMLSNEEFLTKEIKATCKKLKIKYSLNYLNKIKYYLIKNIKGYGKLDPLINDPKVTEITCNSYNDIKAKYKGEVLSTNIAFDTNEEMNTFLKNISEKNNKELSDENPNLDITTDKFKLIGLYNPIMGSKFTISKL